jgi:hypothetical protein
MTVYLSAYVRRIKNNIPAAFFPYQKETATNQFWGGVGPTGLKIMQQKMKYGRVGGVGARNWRILKKCSIVLRNLLSRPLVQGLSNYCVAVNNDLSVAISTWFGFRLRRGCHCEGDNLDQRPTMARS